MTTSTQGIGLFSGAQTTGMDPLGSNNMTALAPLAYTVADRSIQASQAIAVLAAGDGVLDEFTSDDGVKYTRVDIEDALKRSDLKTLVIDFQNSDDTTQTRDFTGYQVNSNGTTQRAHYVDGKKTSHSTTTALLYESNDDFIVQIDNMVFKVPKAGNLDEGQTSAIIEAPNEFGSQSYNDFADSYNINTNTVLGSIILLKDLLASNGHDMDQLNAQFSEGIQADYLAFLEKTLTPQLDAQLTSVSSGIKSAVDFMKKIIQKASQ